MIRVVLASIAWCLALLPATGAADGRKPVEKLVYAAYYNWTFIWIEAGVIEITAGPSGSYPGARRLFAVGRSTKDWIFRVRDTLVSHHDNATFLPREFSRKAHEGSYHKTFDYAWDYPGNKILSRQERLGRYTRKDTIALMPDTYDMLAVAWKMREVDFSLYRKNDLIPVRVLVDSKIYDLHIRYLGQEKVKTGKGKRTCNVFSPLLVEGEVFKGGEGMKVWMSDDESRVPVMLEAKILVGSVKAILDESKSTY
ncbi:MAG: DUF3108 domain-containing protein [Odoribacteraceae bacterium]|jgi:hypothetical protein|nr:DUF3108 domain-containing protein [Odoribacteraceae bacterium]